MVYFEHNVAAAPNQHDMLGSGKDAADDRFGQQMVIKQIIGGREAVVELCGCDAKNRYEVTGGHKQLYISETSECFERCLCGPQRSLTFNLHDGPDDKAPIIYKFQKPCHCQVACCDGCRPKMTILDQRDHMVGRVHDPCRCCTVDNFIYDMQDKLSYIIHGTVCQLGLCCPCGSAKFDIKHATREGSSAGMVTKEFNGLDELCVQANKFVIDFPANTSSGHKALIFGSTMLIDLQYFEKKQ